jgi:hypothetical protein
LSLRTFLLKWLVAAAWSGFVVCDLGLGSREQGHDPGDNEEKRVQYFAVTRRRLP